MLFIIPNSNIIHWKISFINYLGFEPNTDVSNIWFIANRPLGGEPNLFAMVFENLIPIPNTIPKIKNLSPNAQCLRIPSQLVRPLRSYLNTQKKNHFFQGIFLLYRKSMGAQLDLAAVATPKVAYTLKNRVAWVSFRSLECPSEASDCPSEASVMSVWCQRVVTSLSVQGGYTKCG